MGDVCQSFYCDALGLEDISSNRGALRVPSLFLNMLTNCTWKLLNYRQASCQCGLVIWSFLPCFFSSIPACQQAVARRMLLSERTMPIPLDLPLHLGHPAEPQRDGNFLLGDGRTSQPKSILLYPLWKTLYVPTSFVVSTRQESLCSVLWVAVRFWGKCPSWRRRWRTSCPWKSWPRGLRTWHMVRIWTLKIPST